MDVFVYLKMGSLERTFQFCEKRKIAVARSGEYGRCPSVDICSVAKTGGFLVTTLGHNFSVFKSAVEVRLTVPLSIFSSSSMTLVPNRRSVLTRVLTFPTFSSVFIVTGWPVRSSSSTSSLPLHLKSSCHSNTQSF